MKHKLLTTATLLLFVLLTGSCTNEEELVMTPPAITAPDASALSISIAPRSQFAIGGTLPATRAIPTPDDTQWEEKDVVWLYIHFSWVPKGEAEAETKNYVSALRYNGTAWLQLSEEDCTELNTAGIKPYTAASSEEKSYLGFISNPRWPAEALAAGVTDAKLSVKAYFLGNEQHREGIIYFETGNTAGVDVDFMEGSSTSLTPCQPVSVNLAHRYTRLHITSATRVSIYGIPTIPFNLSKGKNESPLADKMHQVLVPEGGSVYFVNIKERFSITLGSDNNDRIPYTLAPGRIDEQGNKIYAGYSYTLVPLNNGTVKPGE